MKGAQIMDMRYASDGDLHGQLAIWDDAGKLVYIDHFQSGRRHHGGSVASNTRGQNPGPASVLFRDGRPWLVETYLGFSRKQFYLVHNNRVLEAPGADALKNLEGGGAAWQELENQRSWFKTRERSIRSALSEHIEAIRKRNAAYNTAAGRDRIINNLNEQTKNRMGNFQRVWSDFEKQGR
jgi:hypothetical protein